MDFGGKVVFFSGFGGFADGAKLYLFKKGFGAGAKLYLLQMDFGGKVDYFLASAASPTA